MESDTMGAPATIRRLTNRKGVDASVQRIVIPRPGDLRRNSSGLNWLSPVNRIVESNHSIAANVIPETVAPYVLGLCSRC